MAFNFSMKKALPHIVAVVLFTIVSFLYFYPVLEGKVLKANDTTVQLINSKEIRDYRAEYGEEPLWTNSIFSGMPAFLISTKYPGNIIKYADTVLRQYGMPVSVLFVSLLGFYILLLMFGVNPWLAIAGAFAYGFTSYFFQILAAGHNTKAIAMAYLPPLTGSIWYAYRKNIVRGALLTALFLSLELQANHIQITYYAFLIILVFGIVELVYALREKAIVPFIRKTLIMIVPVIIAFGVNFASFYTTWEYGKYSIRGKSDLNIENNNVTSGLDKDYIVGWSYGVGETFNMLIPNFKGGSSKPFKRDSETVRALRQNNAANAAGQLPMYWGPQSSTEGPHYVGAVVMFLFVLGLVIVKGPEKWWLLVATILSIMLAWGKHFMPLSNLFIDFFPGYNKFRAVTMILVIADFCIPLLGLLALHNVFSKTAPKDVMKGLKIAAGATGGFLLFAIIMPGIAGSFLADHEENYPDWLRTALVADRTELLRADSFRSLIFIALAAGAIFAYLKGKLKALPAIAAIGALVLLDLWTVDRRYLNSERFDRPVAIEKSFSPTPADAEILKDRSIYRVLNLSYGPGLTFNDNTPTAYFHKSVGGYHGAKMQRYQEFIDSALIRSIDLISAAGSNATTVDEFRSVFESTHALNMLNAKYMIYDPNSPPLVNNYALGNAWFVEKPIMVADANEEIIKLNSFDPQKEALIDVKFSSLVGQNSYVKAAGDTISLVSYKPNELVYRYSADGEKLVVFSEIYYPEGWKVFVDGNESSHFRTNYILRGMVVPGSEHEIRFAFEPESYALGNTVSLASSVLLILAFAGYIFMSLRKRGEQEVLEK